MRNLEGRVAFITGGASGIGLGMAGAFADAGMRVVIADLRQDHIDEALLTFQRRGRSAQLHAIRLDVTDRQAMAAAADEVERVFGKVHVLVNNAGVGIQGPFKGITYADWDFGLAVNLGGVINGLQTSCRASVRTARADTSSTPHRSRHWCPCQPPLSSTLRPRRQS